MKKRLKLISKDKVVIIEGSAKFVNKQRDYFVKKVGSDKSVSDKPAKHEPSLGDQLMITLKDGRKAMFILTQIDGDCYRFDSRDCVGSSAWNDKDDNSGGYPGSKVKQYVDNDLWELLPDELKEIIVPTVRKCKVGDEEIEFRAELFLPAASEIFEPDNCYGDKGIYEQMEYYKDTRNRIRLDAENPNETDWYWTQSTSGGYSTSACYVSSDGLAYNTDCSLSLGVPLCFRIKQRNCANLGIQ